MPKSTITPTRMVLNQQKARLKTATRGHKLLKDKRDELMRQFMEVVRRNRELRTKVEEGLTEAFSALGVASAIMSPDMLEQAILCPRQSVELGIDFGIGAKPAKNIGLFATIAGALPHSKGAHSAQRRRCTITATRFRIR